MRYRDQRLPSDADISLLIESEAPRRARLANVSTTGARVALPGPLPRGAAVVVAYLGHRIPAVVVWSNTRHTGMRFAVVLSVTEATALRREASRTPGGWTPPPQGRLREMR